jgi:hypothetical protein
LVWIVFGIFILATAFVFSADGTIEHFSYWSFLTNILFFVWLVLARCGCCSPWVFDLSDLEFGGDNEEMHIQQARWGRTPQEAALSWFLSFLWLLDWFVLAGSILVSAVLPESSVITDGDMHTSLWYQVALHFFPPLFLLTVVRIPLEKHSWLHLLMILLVWFIFYNVLLILCGTNGFVVYQLNTVRGGETAGSIAILGCIVIGVFISGPFALDFDGLEYI